MKKNTKPQFGHRGQETQRRIIEAALNVTMQHGEGGLTMTKVYKEAGISRTSMYRHFSSTQEIIDHLYNFIKEKYEEGMKESIQANPAAEERLNVVIGYMTHFYQSEYAFRLIQTNPGYLIKLSKVNFKHRVTLYKEVLSPFFDLAEEKTERKIDRGFVAYMLAQYYASIIVQGIETSPKKMAKDMKKLICALSYVDPQDF